MCNDTSGAAMPTACVLQCPQYVRMCCKVTPATYKVLQQPVMQQVIVEPLMITYERVPEVEVEVEVGVGVGTEAEVEVKIKTGLEAGGIS